MIAINNVLVATDFSAPSTTAVMYARAMAKKFGARLHVMHVLEPLWLTSVDAVGGGVGLTAMVEGIEDTARKQLDATITAEDKRWLRATTALITSDSPAREIAQYAGDHQVDLLVIGINGRSGLSRLLIGSEAEKIVRQAPCPVLTVHHPEHEFVLPDSVPAATGTDGESAAG